MRIENEDLPKGYHYLSGYERRQIRTLKESGDAAISWRLDRHLATTGLTRVSAATGWLPFATFRAALDGAPAYGG